VLTWSLLRKFEIYLGRYFSDCSCLFERRVTFCCLHVKCNFELSNIAFDAVIFCRTCSRDSRICLNHRTRLTIHLHGHLNDLVSNEIQASGGLFEMILPSWSDLKKPATHGCPKSLSLYHLLSLLPVLPLVNMTLVSQETLVMCIINEMSCTLRLSSKAWLASGISASARHRYLLMSEMQ